MTRIKQTITDLYHVFNRCLNVCLLFSISASLCLGQDTTSGSQRRTRASGPIKIIQLPQPKTSSGISFEQLLSRLDQTTVPSANPLMVEEIGQIAWAGQGVYFSRTNNTVTEPPQGDLLYNIQLLFATYDGIYQYEPRNHYLEQTTTTDVRGQLAVSSFGPQATPSGCVVLITGSGQRLATRMAQKDRRMLDLKVGQIAQNIKLQAASLNLVSVPAATLDLNVIRRICHLTRNIEPYHMLFVGYNPNQRAGQSQSNTSSAVTPENARPKRAVMIVPPQGFRDEELIDTTKILNASGVITVVASTQAGRLRGMLGMVVQSEVLLDQLQVEKYDALVFVGGSGIVDYINNPLVNAVAGEALRKNKIVGASSTAPMILASAGLLKGTRVTGFIRDQQKLTDAGATYTGNSVERDKLIITAKGPSDATLFGKTIADSIYMN